MGGPALQRETKITPRMLGTSRPEVAYPDAGAVQAALEQRMRAVDVLRRSRLREQRQQQRNGRAAWRGRLPPRPNDDLLQPSAVAGGGGVILEEAGGKRQSRKSASVRTLGGPSPPLASLPRVDVGDPMRSSLRFTASHTKCAWLRVRSSLLHPHALIHPPPMPRQATHASTQPSHLDCSSADPPTSIANRLYEATRHQSPSAKDAGVVESALPRPP